MGARSDAGGSVVGGGQGLYDPFAPDGGFRLQGARSGDGGGGGARSRASDRLSTASGSRRRVTVLSFVEAAMGALPTR